MRMTENQLKRIKALRNRINENGIEALRKADLKGAVLHVRWLYEMGDRIFAEGWRKKYAVRFWEYHGVRFPELGADLRSLSSAKNGSRGGRPSLRPSYCSKAEVDGCKACPLASDGSDCHNNKIGRKWGVE